MNSINSNFIMIDHDFINKSGKKYSGFLGIFQESGQTKPEIYQMLMLAEAEKENKLTAFGSVDEVVKVLNESR